MKGPIYFDVRFRVEVTDGEATRAQIEEALSVELDQDIETDEGAIVNLIAVGATYIKRAQ